MRPHEKQDSQTGAASDRSTDTTISLVRIRVLDGVKSSTEIWVFASPAELSSPGSTESGTTSKADWLVGTTI